MFTDEMMRKLQEKGMEYGIAGVVGGGIDIADRELAERVPAYADFEQKVKFLSSGLLQTLAGIVGIAMDVPYLDAVTVSGVKDLLGGAYKRFVKKDPYLVVKADTIEGYNFDASDTVHLIIDGTAVSDSISTDSKGYFKYQPSTKLSSGKHDIVAYTSKKAVSGSFPV
ncbi:hypothetical protein J7M00_06830 [bacterium]|nr:hypothetical protein [bacterium]